MIPREIPLGTIHPNAAFSLCVQISQFTAKLDDGTCVLVPRKYDEWVVDYHCCTLETLEKDLASRVKWGSCQEVVVLGYDKSTGEETKLVDNMALERAFFENWSERRLFLFVDVEDKPGQIFGNSSVTEVVTINVVIENVIAQGCSSSQPDNIASDVSQLAVPHVDWDSLEIAPISEEQICSSVPVMEEAAMYELLGLRAEDERAEQARLTAEKEKETAPTSAPTIVDVSTEGAEIPVDDLILGEASIFYDREDPPMTVGSTHPSMDEFRRAVRQHAGTEKSDTDRFRGYCTAEGCPWAIVARLMHDEKSVKVTLNKEGHLCASTGRVKTKVAIYHWIAEKAIPYLKKEPNMGAKKQKEELEDKYNITLGYSTVWAGRQKIVDDIFGSWDESFGYLYRFKAEVELRMPRSIVEIDVREEEDGVYFHRFFCSFKPSIDGFLNGCEPYLSIDSTTLNGRWNGHVA